MPAIAGEPDAHEQLVSENLASDNKAALPIDQKQTKVAANHR